MTQVCLASRLFHPVHAGGALRFMRYLPGLKARRVAVRVFTETPSTRRRGSVPENAALSRYNFGEILPAETVEGTPVHRVRLPESPTIRRRLMYHRSLVRFCLRDEWRPDLIQFLSLPQWSVPALLKFRELKIPTVAAYTVTGELSSRRLKRAAQRYYWRWPYQLVSCVVANSTVMRRALRDLGVRTRIEVIPNGVDIERFRPSAETADTAARGSVRGALGIPADAPVVLSVGAICRRKGTDLLLAAWRQLSHAHPAARLILVGPRHDLTAAADAGFHQEVARLLSSLARPENVHFVGQVESVVDYLRAADVLAFTSRREGLPNVILEAMAAGLPVVTTRFGGFPEELGNPGEHFVLVEHSAAAVSDCLGKLLTAPCRRQELRDAARRWVTSQLRLEESVDAYAALYHELTHETAKEKNGRRATTASH